MPLELLEDLVAGVAMDLQPVRLMEWSDVDRYCYHVASTIGLACTSIWQADESLPLQQAIDCGLAFQMTNILRDLREDAARNRIYVPLAELERYGCDVESWLAGAPRGNWPELVSSVIERTRALYASGARTIDHLPQPGARMFALMWSSYRQLLETVDRQKAFLWTNRRVRVTSGQQLKLFAKALVTPTTSERLSRER
jgi:phytoene synthase